jgi:hypothetical protein
MYFMSTNNFNLDLEMAIDLAGFAGQITSPPGIVPIAID